MGRAFSLDVLAEARERDEGALASGIDELLQRRIIREHAGNAGGSSYDFSHDKIREVVLMELSVARSRVLHRSVAKALETAHAGQLDAHAGQIAAHYEQAGLLERAVHYYQRAADAARRMYANDDAIQHYQRAQRLAELQAERGSPAPTPLPAIGESLGDTLHHVTREDDARLAYAQALEHVDSADAILRARLQRKIGCTWRDQRQYEPAMQAFSAAEGELGDPLIDAARTRPEWWREWIQVQLDKDTVFYWQGQVDASTALLGRLQPIIEARGTAGQRASFFQSLAARGLRRNRNVATDEVVAHWSEALDAFTQAGDQSRIPSATFAVAFALLWRGSPERAEKPMLDALAMAERRGDASLVARCVTYLTIVYRQLGGVEQAQQFVERSFEAAARAQMPEYTALAEANAAWIAWRGGDWDGVRRHGQAAVALWKALPAGHASAPFQWTARCPLIAAALQEANIDAAVEHAAMLLEPAMQRLSDPLTEPLQRAVDAWALARRQDAHDALELSLSEAQRARLL